MMMVMMMMVVMMVVVMMMLLLLLLLLLMMMMMVAAIDNTHRVEGIRGGGSDGYVGSSPLLAHSFCMPHQVTGAKPLYATPSHLAHRVEGIRGGGSDGWRGYRVRDRDQPALALRARLCLPPHDPWTNGQPRMPPARPRPDQRKNITNTVIIIITITTTTTTTSGSMGEGHPCSYHHHPRSLLTPPSSSGMTVVYENQAQHTSLEVKQPWPLSP
jgi:hypothetical protein